MHSVQYLISSEITEEENTLLENLTNNAIAQLYVNKDKQCKYIDFMSYQQEGETPSVKSAFFNAS